MSRKRTVWTEEMIGIVEKLYPHVAAKDIAKKLGIGTAPVYKKAYDLGLKKSKTFLANMAIGLAERGQAYRFQKGHIPSNAGQTMSEEQYKKCETTMFKKGRKPHNTKKDGTISIRNDKRIGRPYKWIRLAMGKWQLLHRVEYEKHHGTIPKGMVVVFKDGDSMNCDIGNLEMISMKQNMIRNSIQQYPEELKDVLRLRSKLERKIKKHEQQK